MRRAPWLLLLLALLVRALVSARTAVPGRDGASYLWMAESFARGEPQGLFATVFHPLYPALVGLLLRSAPGLDPQLAGQLVAGGLGAAAVVPLFFAARRLFGPTAAAVAGAAYALGAWFARHPAECMSEGPFYLCVCTWALAVARRRPRPALAGVAAGLGYLLRPEGGSMWLVAAAVLMLQRRFADAVRLTAVAAPLCLLLPLGYWLAGHGLTLTPKAAFNYEVGIGAEPQPVLHYLREAAVLPLAAAEQLGWLWLPLVAAGVLRRWRRRPLRRDPAAILLWPFLLQAAVAPLLFSHWRFLSGYSPLLLPFAGAAAVRLWGRLRRRGPVLAWLLPVLLLAAEARVAGARNGDAAIERDLGRWLRTQLRPGEIVVSDMPRLEWYAGQQPPPPRPILADRVLARAARAECRFVALVAGRTAVAADDLRRLGLEPLPLPPILTGTGGRHVHLFARDRTR